MHILLNKHIAELPYPFTYVPASFLEAWDLGANYASDPKTPKVDPRMLSFKFSVLLTVIQSVNLNVGS